jgi:hypothetical protein
VSSALLLPVKDSNSIDAEVPEKAKEMPVADHANSFVAGLTRPR